MQFQSCSDLVSNHAKRLQIDRFALSQSEGEMLSRYVDINRDDESCRLCYNNGTHCETCHNSASSVYYTSYYATYYSDFYSEYYAKYYTDSIRLVDEKAHPSSSSKL